MATPRGYGKDVTLLETLEIDETAIYFNRMRNTPQIIIIFMNALRCYLLPREWALPWRNISSSR